MKSQPTSSVSPYHVYRQPSFETLLGLVFHDRDGMILYEDAMCASLLLKIIKTHDDEFLKRYLEINPRGLGIADVPHWDPFYVGRRPLPLFVRARRARFRPSAHSVQERQARQGAPADGHEPALGRAVWEHPQEGRGGLASPQSSADGGCRILS